jgi:hypothetical protein
MNVLRNVNDVMDHEVICEDNCLINDDNQIEEIVLKTHLHIDETKESQLWHIQRFHRHTMMDNLRGHPQSEIDLGFLWPDRTDFFFMNRT